MLFKIIGLILGISDIFFTIIFYRDTKDRWVLLPGILGLLISICMLI